MRKTYPEPSLAVLSLDLVAVTHPVPVPSPQSRRVMYTNGISILQFETGTLELINDESDRCAGVCAREDIFVHEQAPDEILILP